MCSSSLFHVVAKEAVELGVRDGAGQAVKLAGRGDVARRADHRGPGDARERAAQADAAHPEAGEIVHRELGCARHQEIHRFRRHRLDHRRDLLARPDAGRVEAVGAGRREGLEATHRLIEIGLSADEALAARRKHHIAAGLIDCGTRRAHARQRKLEIVERDAGVGGRILDRQPRDSGIDAQRHAFGHALGCVRKAALEVGVHGNVGGGSDLAEMGEHRRARHGAVGAALGESEARAGRGQRLESETLQIARRAHVPGVGDDEASLRVELEERRALFGGRGHGGASFAIGGVGEGDCLESSALCRMDRARRLRQPKELARAPVALEGGLAMPSFADHAASRRKFLQLLAASPLWGTGAAFAGEGFAPGSKLPDPLMWAPMRADDLIKSPKEAINVFDFEPVCRKNVPPAHFGYMASGIDDEATLRANREGFLKFQLRPRRLVDVSKVDMSTEILGVKYASPIVLAPVGGQRSFHDEGEVACARAAKVGDHLQILSTAASLGVEDVTSARGKPIWYQLYATNKWEVAEAMVKRAEKAGCLAVAVTVDRASGRNQETFFRLRATDTRDCSGCHDRSSLQSSMRTRAMYQGIDLSGLTNTQASAMTWDFFKRLRDTTKMKIVIKGILAWEDAVIAADNGIDAIIVSNHGARSEDSGRSTIDALPEIVEAVNGRIPIIVDSGFRRGSDVVKALCIGANAVCVGRPYIWGLGAFGQSGVERVLELLRAETYAMMQQVGAPSIKQLVPAMVRRAT